MPTRPPKYLRQGIVLQTLAPKYLRPGIRVHTTRYYTVLQGTTWYYSVLLGTTRYYLVLPGTRRSIPEPDFGRIRPGGFCRSSDPGGSIWDFQYSILDSPKLLQEASEQPKRTTSCPLPAKFLHNVPQKNMQKTTQSF